MNKKCEVCNNILKKGKRFCSRTCHGIWQSKYRVGDKAGNYNKSVSIEDRTLICEWCNSSFQVRPSEIHKARFCSINCKQKWQGEVFFHSEEWKTAIRESNAKLRENGTYTENSSIQLKINELLDKLKINYIKEKRFGYFNVDNYLVDSKLIIENMGEYWHCDNRVYPMINYETQVNRIRMDKIKHKSIKEHHYIEVLYLWENEILNNIELCIVLIKKYIENKGILENYHSFNYSLIDDELVLNNNIIIPYMDWQRKDLNNIIDTTVKEKINRKQDDKWTTYYCDYCGIEDEELTSHYIRQTRHYCSKKCLDKALTIPPISCLCNNCNKEVFVPVHKYKVSKHKRFFCNKDCQHTYQKNIGFKTEKGDTTTFNCDFCGKIATQKTCDYNKSKYHNCSRSCAAKGIHKRRKNNSAHHAL